MDGVEPISVLLVDDDQVFARVLGRELGRKGFDVRTASSGDEALAALAEVPADVVLLDLRLGDADGLEVLAALRARPQPPEVLIRHPWPGNVREAFHAVQAAAAL